MLLETEVRLERSIFCSHLSSWLVSGACSLCLIHQCCCALQGIFMIPIGLQSALELCADGGYFLDRSENSPKRNPTETVPALKVLSIGKANDLMGQVKRIL